MDQLFERRGVNIAARQRRALDHAKSIHARIALVGSRDTIIIWESDRSLGQSLSSRWTI